MERIDTVTVEPSRQLLGNDLVINEESCNLGCHYCLTGQSNMKAGHTDQLIFEPPTFDEYREDTDLGKRLHTIVDRVNSELAPPLIKLTGGEIFIIKGMMDFVEKMAQEHVSVIVQSNGLTLSSDKIQRLAKLKNVIIQISLDSNEYEGNSYRVQSEKLHNKLMNRIAAVAHAGLPTEIYAVLNDKSAPHMASLVKWCAQFDENPLQIFPFPVRGPDSQKYQVRPEQYHYVDGLHDMLDQYDHVLPPKEYLDRLSAFYHDGERSWRCHLPRLVVSTFSDGVATPCPNIWFHSMGKLTEDASWKGALDQVNRTAFYELLLGSRPRLDACKGCFTPWDTLSLYFESKISLDELCRAPSYAAPPIRALLESKKKEYLESQPAGTA